MKRGIRQFPRLWRVSRLARRWYYARRDAYPDWRGVLAAGSKTNSRYSFRLGTVTLPAW